MEFPILRSPLAAVALRRVALTVIAALGLGVGCAGPEYAMAPCYAPPAVVTPQAVATVQPAVTMVQPAVATYANPVFLPTSDPQCAWEQTVDMVDDYFRIDHEEPVRAMGNVLTEGAITTRPEVSPTVFEPWRRDTADARQRWENTLQSIRRRAVVRVVPARGGHWVDVQVFKELEDVVRPEQSTAGAATLRYDGSLTRVVDPIGGQQATQGWIAQGRDTSLEQSMISDLLSRSGQSGQPMVVRGQDAASKP
jgi:hypothetical protein